MAAHGISAAESRIMEAVWARGALTVDEIMAAVSAENGWGEATVRTLISRLIKKQALKSERRGGRVAYVPLLTREAYVTAESQGLLDRLFGGSMAPMVAHFTRNKVLSPDEVAKLRRLLAELDAEEDD
ncbi:BlaI/MecI/CopY family transcriptional regulator [Phenylobacterium sp. VNQ135]|uniref:BlaI/MecI/CopY family transcriptional regulator n=1 Tax=Phenylobacterium sp. VNQ135 TaxID=3400922 RepID=UPI003C087012